MITTPIYCVTLREEPWKQQAAQKHFDELNLKAKFIYGFQGVTAGLKPTNPYEFTPDGKGVYLHPAPLGCLVSHRMALTLAIANGDADFIITEDDVEFDACFVMKHDVLQRILHKDAAPRVIQLEYCSTEGKAIVVDGMVATCRPYPYCAAAIWWNREAAMSALALMRLMDRPYDIMLIERVYPFMDHLIVVPPAARQKSNHFGEAVGTTAWPSSIGSAMR